MDLYLMRHFEVEGRKGAFYGSSEVTLRCRQKREAITLNKDFLVLSSPRLRCQQSLEALSLEAEICDGAREVDFGDWEGKTFAELEKEDPKGILAWQNDKDFAFPKGESLSAFYERIEDLAQALIKREQEKIFLLCHGGVIRYLISYFLGLDWEKSLAFRVDYGSLSKLKVFADGGGVLEFLNNKQREQWPKLLL